MTIVDRSVRALVVAAFLVLLSAGCAELACAGEGAGEGAGVGSPSAEAATPSTAEAKPPVHVPSLEVRVVGVHPHRKDAFTQGLVLDDGVLYESTGQYGASSLRKVDPETGKVLEERDLPPELFGEGLALVPRAAGDRLLQITWKEGVALAWDRARLEQVGEHRYRGEGWGLTFDGKRLVMSDGSSWLTFRDPETFDEISRVRVSLEGRPLSFLNELEWVDGAVWANVWGSTTIVRIDPASGAVTATADLGVLYDQIDPAEAQGMDVLNGIAYRPDAKTAPASSGASEGAEGAAAAGDGSGGVGGGGVFLVTGKYWPRLFEVTLRAPGG